MQMQPVVDRLEADYDGQVGVIRANAEDGGAGQAAFRDLRLPGHPSVIIIGADGSEVFRGFGILEESTLRTALDAIIKVQPTVTP
jgi:hypothetical protein